MQCTYIVYPCIVFTPLATSLQYYEVRYEHKHKSTQPTPNNNIKFVFYGIEKMNYPSYATYMLCQATSLNFPLMCNFFCV